MELEKIMILDDVKQNIAEAGGVITVENLFSIGECKYCKNGDWINTNPQDSKGDVCEFYICNNENCNIPHSTVSFNVSYGKISEVRKTSRLRFEDVILNK